MTDDARPLIVAVRRYVRERLVALERQVEETAEVPLEVIDEMRALGLFGLSIPEEYGGIGLSLHDETQVIYEIGYTSPAFRAVFGTNVGIGSQGLLMDGTADQKARYLPRLASGEVIGSFCLTEPDAGSDAASLRTRAVRDGDEYVLTGTKRYITNAERAGLFTVLARTGSVEERGRGVSAFLVEAGRPGIALGPAYKKMGQRGAPVCDVVFDEVRVPAAGLIGEREGQGFKTAMKVLDRGRLHIAALVVGAARRLIEEATRFALERRQFGKPIAEFQLIQAMIADSETECYAGRCMIDATTRKHDAGQRVSRQASCCKLFCTEMAGRVADRAVQIHGGAGYIADYPVERFYRDVRLTRLYEGTSEIQRLIIAKSVIDEMAG